MVKASLHGLKDVCMSESGNKDCLSFKERSNLLNILLTLLSDQDKNYLNDIDCKE